MKTDTLTLPACPVAPATGSPELTMPELTVVDTERDVFAKNRDTIMAALREQGDKQIKGQIHDGMGGVCFVGCAVQALNGKSL